MTAANCLEVVLQMKRHILFALVYAALAMACGVFYREFTKAYAFTGDTALGKVHTHLFLLGMVVFLLFALFDAKLHLQKHKLYLPFMVVYNAGVGVMSIMLIVRGVFEVTGAAAPDGAISGVAGLGHILVAAGIVLFFVMLLLSLRKGKKGADAAETAECAQGEAANKESE